MMTVWGSALSEWEWVQTQAWRSWASLSKLLSKVEQQREMEGRDFRRTEKRWRIKRTEREVGDKYRFITSDLHHCSLF